MKGNLVGAGAGKTGIAAAVAVAVVEIVTLAMARDKRVVAGTRIDEIVA